MWEIREKEKALEMYKDWQYQNGVSQSEFLCYCFNHDIDPDEIEQIFIEECENTI